MIEKLAPSIRHPGSADTNPTAYSHDRLPNCSPEVLAEPGLWAMGTGAAGPGMDQGMEAAVLNAIARVTGGNFRHIQRLFVQIDPVLPFNSLATVTSDVVDLARESLVVSAL